MNRLTLVPLTGVLLLTVVGLQAQEESKRAPAPESKPAVTARLGTGAVVEKRGDATMNCTISDPLSKPVKYPQGTKALLVQVDIDPRRASLSSIEIAGLDFGGARKVETCFNYIVLHGQPKRNRYGCKITRGDGEAFQSGSYRLLVLVEGDSEPAVELPFRIE